MTNESLVTDDANESKKKLPKPTQERLIKLLSVLDQLEKENQKLITPKTTVTSAIIERGGRVIQFAEIFHFWICSAEVRSVTILPN